MAKLSPHKVCGLEPSCRPGALAPSGGVRAFSRDWEPPPFHGVWAPTTLGEGLGLVCSPSPAQGGAGLDAWV